MLFSHFVVILRDYFSTETQKYVNRTARESLTESCLTAVNIHCVLAYQLISKNPIVNWNHVRIFGIEPFEFLKTENCFT